MSKQSLNIDKPHQSKGVQKKLISSIYPKQNSNFHSPNPHYGPVIDLSKKFPSSIWSRYGSSQGYVGYNIDVNEFRAMALEASKTDERFLQQYKLGAAKKGVLAGESPEQQWTWIQNYINNFRKIAVEKK